MYLNMNYNAFNVTILHFKLNFKIFISDLNTHQAFTSHSFKQTASCTVFKQTDPFFLSDFNLLLGSWDIQHSHKGAKDKVLNRL